MDTNKNSYIFIYASVMVVIVAFLLAFVSSALKPIQQKNIDLDKKKQILSALNVFEKDAAAAEAAYDKYIKAELLLNADGTVKSETGAFAVESGKIGEELPLYVCEVEGETKYIVPLFGAGLWNVIWGYIALNDDKETIYGVYFSHAGETPGLGAEITNYEIFQKPFIGKYAMKNGEPAISVVKFGKVADTTCEVDGISGGTITSVGVDNMLKTCLGYYKPFLNQKACEKACTAACCDSTACAVEVPAEVIEVVNQ